MPFYGCQCEFAIVQLSFNNVPAKFRRWNSIALQPLVLILMMHCGMASRISPSSLTVDPPPMIGDDINPACYNFSHGNYHNMEFYSPNYPGQYPLKIDCVMYLQAPPGFHIELYFMEKFSMEESDGCKYDFIELRDGPFAYSKFIARFCGDGFPVHIQTESRFLWARFKTDDVMQMGGFKAVYEYKINKENTLAPSSDRVCRLYMDNMAPDGELNSNVFPIAGTLQLDDPSETIDCTWEMLTEKGSRILLSAIRLNMQRDGQCNRNRIEIYDRTTSEEDRTGVYCVEPVQEYKSVSNRVFIRIYGSRLSEKPGVVARYTTFRPANTQSQLDACSSKEFRCDDMCLRPALVCNGHMNCPSGLDEQDCETESAGSKSEGIPLMVFILAGVGGIIFTVFCIAICVTCRFRKNKHHYRGNGLKKQDSKKRNALEMAVSDSGNTAYQLAKQNNQSSYYSLPRPAGHTTLGNFSSKVPSEGDYGDHMSDSNTYKKFLQREQSMDDDSSRCPSPYSPGYVIEHHPLPTGMTSDIGWNFQVPGETTIPSLAENLSKLQQYTHFNSSKGISTKVEPPNVGMTMDFRYDPSTPIYSATKFRIKSPEVKYGWTAEDKTRIPIVKSLTFKNQDSEIAPDLTREIETT